MSDTFYSESTGKDEPKQELSAYLSAAIKSGEVLSLIYHGGSNPGGQREIAPVSVKAGKMRGRCYISNAVKTFDLKKIEIEGVYYAEAIEPASEVITLDKLKQFAQEKGLHFSEEGGWTVHGLFKNGKIKKTPLAGIYISDEGFRPYYVFGPELEVARSYKNEQKALDLLYEQISSID